MVFVVVGTHTKRVITQQLWAFPKYWTLQCKINFN